jgi:ATP-dependent DNA ligase
VAQEFAPQRDLTTPPLYMVFDLLQLGDKDYRPEPLKARRKALEKLVKSKPLILPARRLSPNGLAAWTEVLHRGYGGMVAKDPESPYVGGRTLKWLKVKVPEGSHRHASLALPGSRSSTMQLAQ